jgi:hypothetical protein
VNISRVRSRLKDLRRQIEVARSQATPQISYIAVQPGGSLPDGKSEEDFDYIVWLSSIEFPHEYNI